MKFESQVSRNTKSVINVETKLSQFEDKFEGVVFSCVWVGGVCWSNLKYC